MTFLSGMFFVLLFATFGLYFIMPLRMRWIVLLASSLIFYLSWGWQALPVVIASTLLVFFAALWIERTYEAQDQKIKEEKPDNAAKKDLKLRTKAKCRRMLTIAAVILVTMLVYTKAGDRILDSLIKDQALRTSPWLEIAVPLGISYYTFSLLSYLADVYWRKEKAEKNILKFFLWVIFFPKILQGPIARHKKMAQQLNQGNPFDYQRVCYGLQLSVWGYFKKMVIADRLSVFVTSVFSNCYEETSSLIFVIAAMLGGVQLYCDFSGCMDMAEGFCQVLGIDLERNFRRPFFSRSVSEFWRRWHITLGTWFKDYVYMPLAISPQVLKIAQWTKKVFGVRASKSVMVIIPTAIVWVLTGLWHGTGYNYIAWGIYWGALIICSSVFAPEIKKLTGLLRINTEAASWRVIQMIRTFLLFSFGRLLTMPGYLQTTWDILKKIVQKFDIWILFDGSLYNYGLNAKNFNLAMFGIVVLWCVGMLQEKGSVREMIARNNLAVRWIIYYAAFFAVVVFGIWGSGAASAVFTYMNY